MDEERETARERNEGGGSLQELPEERPGRAGAVDTGDWLLLADGGAGSGQDCGWRWRSYP